MSAVLDGCSRLKAHVLNDARTLATSDEPALPDATGGLRVATAGQLIDELLIITTLHRTTILS